MNTRANLLLVFISEGKQVTVNDSCAFIWNANVSGTKFKQQQTTLRNQNHKTQHHRLTER